jgi:hypothetical protein
MLFPDERADAANYTEIVGGRDHGVFDPDAQRADGGRLPLAGITLDTPAVHAYLNARIVEAEEESEKTQAGCSADASSMRLVSTVQGNYIRHRIEY